LSPCDADRDRCGGDGKRYNKPDGCNELYEGAGATLARHAATRRRKADPSVPVTGHNPRAHDTFLSAIRRVKPECPRMPASVRPDWGGQGIAVWQFSGVWLIKG
jgi:hypothetical protein